MVRKVRNDKDVERGHQSSLRSQSHFGLTLRRVLPLSVRCLFTVSLYDLSIALGRLEASSG